MISSLRRKLLVGCVGLFLSGVRVGAGDDFPLYPAHPVHPAVERPPTPLWSGYQGGRMANEGEAPEEALETDRDSFTPATTTAGQDRLIVESSYSFVDNRSSPENHSFPELLLRYGVTERIEARLGWNYEVGGGGNDVSSSGFEDLSGGGVEREHRILYGVKVGLSDACDLIPASAVIVQGYTPTGGEANDTHVFGTFVAGWDIEGCKVDAALRYGTNSESDDRFGVMAPSIVVKVPVTECLNVHGEFFSLFSRERSVDFVKHYLSPGVHYLITPDLEIGLRVGWGLNDQSARFFGNTGIGLRF